MTPLGTVSRSTLGIVGFGAVGQALAAKALALGMRVVAIRRSDQPFEIDGVARASNLAELFERSDHVVLAAPSTAHTDYMIDARLLEHAKPGLHLINIARGALIDDAALIAALDSGRVSLATLDSTDPEPLPAGHAYYTHPRVRLSPHTSMATSGALELLTDKLVDNLARYRAGRPLTDIVDIARGY
jgi:phosphoglycerate dehydrogenase-like enzyme